MICEDELLVAEDRLVLGDLGEQLLVLGLELLALEARQALQAHPQDRLGLRDA